jgi:hypothetical protein
MCLPPSNFYLTQCLPSIITIFLILNPKCLLLTNLLLSTCYLLLSNSLIVIHIFPYHHHYQTCYNSCYNTTIIMNIYSTWFVRHTKFCNSRLILLHTHLTIDTVVLFLLHRCGSSQCIAIQLTSNDTCCSFNKYWVNPPMWRNEYSAERSLKRGLIYFQNITLPNHG